MDKISNPNPLVPDSGLNVQNLPRDFRDGDTGLIGAVLASGTYLTVLRDGTKVKVKGPLGLEVGNPVRVFLSPADSTAGVKGSIPRTLLLESEAILALTALLPLAFGGNGAKAKIEVYTPKEKVNTNKKKVIYFIIALTTERLGDLQWSIHLWGRNAEIQLFCGGKKNENDIRNLLLEVENSVRKAGFLLTGSVQRLDGPFQVPQGFRLDWMA